MDNLKNTLRVGTDYDSLVSKYGEALVNTEIDLELESKELAKNHFLNNLYKRASEHELASMGTTKQLLKEALPVFIKCLDEFRTLADSGKSGRRHLALSLLKDIPSDVVSFITLKVILSQTALYPTSTLVGLCRAVGSALQKEARYRRVLLGDKKAEKGLDNRLGLTYKEAYLRAVEKSKTDSGEVSEWEHWEDRNKVNVGLKMVELFCSSTGLGHLEKLHDNGKWSYLFVLDREVSQYIMQNDKDLADMVFKCRPMVIPPKEWTNPFDGGYYIKLKRSDSFVKAPRRVVREVYKDVYMPNVYKAVNAIQSTKWRINKRVLEVAQEVLNWRVIPEGLNVPPVEPPEAPLRPIEADTDPEVQKAWRLEMVRYYRDIASNKGKRLLSNALVSEAMTFKDYEAIYFPHNVDFRGRVYPLTTLSPQSNDLGKSLIEFAEGVPLGNMGVTWLAFHGANCYGLDKKPIEERIAWVYSNQDFILSIAKNPLDNLAWTETDSPWEFLAFCFDWEGYVNYGSSDYRSHLPVAFDGSCSGIQHFSAMLKDEIGGKAVNLIPDDHVNDIYQIVADKVIELLNEDSLKGSEDTFEKLEDGSEYLKKGTLSLSQEWLNFGVTRKVVKRSVMTLPYGSKQYGFADQVLEDTIYPAIAKNPLAFSKPSQAGRYLASLIWKSVGQVVVKAVEAMAWLQEASGLLAQAKDINGNPLPVTWVTPAGFPVRQKYEKVKNVRVKSILNGSIMIVDNVEKTKEVLGKGDILCPSMKMPIEGSIDPRKQRQGIAPNFVHSMDASHLMLTVCSCVAQGVDSFAMIHDSYGTHAGKADIMFKTVRDVFVTTYSTHNVLRDLHDHIYNLLPPKLAEKLPDIPKEGTLDLENVKTSVYAFS